MKIRSKLFLYFLALSTLIIVVGVIFYAQLQSLITPLTPKSIPQNVEKLVKSINRNELVYQILQQQLLVQQNLEHYVFTNQELDLKKYHLNHTLLINLLERAKKIDPQLGAQLDIKMGEFESDQTKVIDNMKANNIVAAKALLASREYVKLSAEMIETLNVYYQNFNVLKTEDAIVTTKLALKNTRSILEDSMNATLIIFFDALVISLLFSFISSRAISQPINLLRNNIERMKRDYTNVPINEKLLAIKGEIGDLSRSFASLIETLRRSTVLRDELLLEIDRRKEFEERQQQTAFRLQESIEELDQFAYIASHDLRAPLRAIESLADWIKQDCYEMLPTESKHHFDLIKKRAARLESLIIGILEYSRAAKLTAPLEQVDLNALLKEVVEDLSPPEHIKITFENDFPTFLVNKVAIKQVFLNLISNAIKYNDKKFGIIKINVTEDEKYYEFSVYDNGPGIEKKFHEKIFEIFQTLQSRDTVESTGMGLAIVKKIIEKQCGRIWVVSVPRQETTFYFTWPKV